MFELTINDNVYQFNFGMGFLRKIDPIVTKPLDDGIKGKVQNLGLRYAVGALIDNDPEMLVDVLLLANEGNTPRLQKKEIESHIENENTEDFVRYTFYIANNFVEDADVMKYQLKLSYGPTEKAASANVLPTGTAIFKNFEFETLTKEEKALYKKVFGNAKRAIYNSFFKCNRKIRN